MLEDIHKLRLVIPIEDTANLPEIPSEYDIGSGIDLIFGSEASTSLEDVLATSPL